MNVFALIRRSIWAVLLAACIVVGCAYLAFSQTFLTSVGLTHILQQSRLAETVREETLLPKVLASSRSSNYSALLDDKTVTEAFNAAITTDALNAKLAPAIDALQLWLNSKEPSIQFTISMNDLSDNFAAKLAESVSAKVAALPQCTRQNTLADVENAICRSPLITDMVLRANINEAIKSDPALKENITISSETIPELAELRSESSLPSYLNMFYAFTLVATAVMVLISLWLLFKHRFAGIITIGAACILAATTLLIGSAVSHAATAQINDPLLSKVIFAATQSLSGILQQYALLLAGGGIIAIIIGVVFLIVLSRRRRSRQTMHMSSEDNIPKTK